MTQTGGNLIMNNDVSFGAAQTWAVTNTKAITVNGILSGASGNTLTKSDLGTLMLAGANTYSGGTILDAGTLTLNNAKALGTGVFTINGGTFGNTSGAISNFNNNAQNWNGDFAFNGKYNLNLGTGAVTLGGNRTVSNTYNYGALIVGGTIADGGHAYSLTKVGDGTLALAGSNTYSGGTILNAGTLLINNARALGTGAFTINGGTIDNNTEATVTNANNNAQYWNGDFAFHGSMGLDLGAGAVTLGGNRAVSNGYNVLTVSGAINDGGKNYSLTKIGAGTLTLAGANTYGGATIITGGILRIANAKALGSAAAGTTVNAGGELELSGGITVTNEQLILNGGELCNLASTDTYSSAITLMANSVVDSDSGTLKITSTISGAHGLEKAGAGTVELSGVNTYSGTTTISAGTLVASNTLALQNSTLNYTNNGGAIRFSSGIAAYTFGGLEGNKNIALTNASGTAIALTVGNNSSDTTYSGALSAGGRLIKTGAGNLTLAGANTYTNTTTVSSGGLIVDGSMLSKQITVSAGATLGGTSTVQAVTMNAGSILAVGDGRGTMTFNGALLLSAGSTNIMEVFSASLYDVLKGTGGNALTANGTFVFDFTGNTTLTNGSTFAVLQNWKAITTDSATFKAIGLDAGKSLDTSKLASTGYVTVIPEPAVVSLIAFIGFLSLFVRRRFLA